MTAQQLWDLFTHADGPVVPFEAWAFGGAPDELAALVLAGRKTATSTAKRRRIRLNVARTGETK